MIYIMASMEETKKCSLCKNIKNINDFPVKVNGGRYSRCVLCKNKQINNQELANQVSKENSQLLFENKNLKEENEFLKEEIEKLKEEIEKLKNKSDFQVKLEALVIEYKIGMAL
jgi:hypothetical protein